MVVRHLLLAAWLLGVATLAAGAATDDAEFLYNPYMASLSTAPVPFNGMYGHWHSLTAANMPSLDTADSQMQLLTVEPCGAFAPHYHTNCGETLVVKSGVLDVVLVVEGEVLRHTLRRGDLAVVPAGSLHSYTNPGCEEAEALIVLSSSLPDTVYPITQLLGLPQQAQISSFGVHNFSEFQGAINLPKSQMYLSNPQCKAACSASTPPPASRGGKPPAQRRSLQSGAAGAARRALASDSQTHGGGGGRVYNDFMASLSEGPVFGSNSHADRRRLTHEQLPALGKARAEALWTRYLPCSTSVPRFQANANELTTVLSGTIDVILVVNGTRRVVRTLQPGDVAVIPLGVLSYLANANCKDAVLLTLFTARGANRVFPVSDLLALPQGVLAAALGVESMPAWTAALEAPPGSLASLADPQCTTRCAPEGTVTTLSLLAPDAASAVLQAEP